MIYILFAQFHNLFVEVPSNHFLIINMLVSIVVDYFYRMVACLLAFISLFIYKKYKRIDFGSEITRIQIYEVFEEHVKLGIVYQNDEEESEEQEEEEEDIKGFAMGESIFKS